MEINTIHVIALGILVAPFVATLTIMFSMHRSMGRFDGSVDGLHREVDGLRREMDRRFENVCKHLTRIEERLDKLLNKSNGS